MRFSSFLREKHGVRLEYLLLILILIGYFVFQFPSLFHEAYEQFDNWRQTDTYSIALNYLQYDMNPLAPQFNYDGTSDIYIQLELQIVPYLSALIFLVTGHITPFVPRLLSLLFYLGSAVFLYGIMRKFASVFASLTTVLIYLFLPISLLYSRAIMPEACANFFYCGAIFFLLDWYTDGPRRSIWLSAIFMAFAIMEKVPVAFAGLLVLAVFLWKEKGKCLRDIAFWGYGVISLCIPALYYGYSALNATMSYVNGIATKRILTPNLFDLFDSAAVSFFKMNMPQYFSIAVLLCASIGFFLCFSKKRKPFVVWAIAFFLETVTIVAIIQFGYYLIFLAPVLAALCGILLDALRNKKMIVSLGVFLLIFGASLYRGIPLYNEVVCEKEDIRIIAECIEQVAQPSDVIAIADSAPSCLNAANRHGYRANIQYHAHIPIGAKEETDYYRQQGVAYFVAPYGAVYNDSTGEYIAYLNETFPIVLQNEYCTIYNLQEVK